MTDTRRLSAVALALMLAFIAAVIVLNSTTVTKRDLYEQCVAAIPGYLDATEILYQEQECHQR
jgi:hypothetical protein